MVLAYLGAQLTQLTDETNKSRLERLIEDMQGFLGLGGGTITDLFERNKGSLSRPLLLFCLREHCKDLLEFSHPLLSDTEYLLSGILFGVRDGWLRLPYEMRNQALSAYIMFRMTDVAHQKQGDVFSGPKRQAHNRYAPYSLLQESYGIRFKKRRLSKLPKSASGRTALRRSLPRLMVLL